jgi:hypothetical protein
MRIVEMHGAIVAVEDRPGGGAAFSIRFPAVLAPDDPSTVELQAVGRATAISAT